MNDHKCGPPRGTQAEDWTCTCGKEWLLIRGTNGGSAWVAL